MDSIYKEALVLAVSKLPQGNAKRLDLERRLRGVLNAQGLESVKTELFNESRNLKLQEEDLLLEITTTVLKTLLIIYQAIMKLEDNYKMNLIM
ncbi:Uncharacterised protein (plasmid) [Mycoplasmopsis canis]|nr:hypothetical protein [Mycoplasmopsis canis]VEU69249.1 Uncharacterised protein [Mycoplasmopsis canis]